MKSEKQTNDKDRSLSIVLIDSEVIKKFKSMREIGWNQDVKINKEDDKVRSYYSNINVLPGEGIYQAIELFEVVNSENGFKKTISIPCFVTNKGKLISLQKANPSLFADLIIGRMNLMKSKEVKGKQEQLIESLQPMVEAKKFSFISLLPLIQDKSSLNFSLQVDRLALAIDLGGDGELSDKDCEYLQDLVREDDVIKTSVPLLNANLVTHPKVAPILARLFEGSDSEGDAKTKRNRITI